LVDSGPLIALFDKDDRHHRRVAAFFKKLQGHLMTTWLVATEVGHLLDFSVQAQVDFLTWIDRGGLEVVPIEASDIKDLIDLILKYQDRPMDFADASLVVLAQKAGLDEIVSLDQDFSIYRLPRKKKFRNLLSAFRE